MLLIAIPLFIRDPAPRSQREIAGYVCCPPIPPPQRRTRAIFGTKRRRVPESMDERSFGLIESMDLEKVDETATRLFKLPERQDLFCAWIATR